MREPVEPTPRASMMSIVAAMSASVASSRPATFVKRPKPIIMTIVAAENRGLADDLSQWSDQSESADRGLPARLAHRVEPYTPLLLAMLGDAA